MNFECKIQFVDRDRKGDFPKNFSVSGTLFLGVVGALLVVIMIMTTIIAVIVCTSVKSRNGKRSHSIGGKKVT